MNVRMRIGEFEVRLIYQCPRCKAVIPLRDGLLKPKCWRCNANELPRDYLPRIAPNEEP